MEPWSWKFPKRVSPTHKYHRPTYKHPNEAFSQQKIKMQETRNKTKSSLAKLIPSLHIKCVGIYHVRGEGSPLPLAAQARKKEQRKTKKIVQLEVNGVGICSVTSYYSNLKILKPPDLF